MSVAVRRARNRVDIWPGYVDAMAALLMVVIFLLLVFVTAQVLLSHTVSQQDTELFSLRQRLAEITELLGLERDKNADLSAKTSALGDLVSRLMSENDDLVGQVENLSAERTALLDRVNAQERTMANLERDLGALGEVRGRLESQVSQLDDSLDMRRDQAESLIRDRNRVRAELEATRETLARRSADLATRQAELDEERRISAAARAELELLNRQIAALRRQLQEIGQALAAAEADKRDQQAEIADLGRRLNLALAREVNQLRAYQSEFFGRLREVLGDNPDIRVEGDRFVLSSELLFASGTDRLGAAGQQQLLRLANTLRELATRIPADLDWVLRVDGHTDRVPINTSRFPSNWELSTARAVSVVRFLIAQGIAPERLVAAGFGEHRPLDPASTETAFARNRRIEFKLTSR